jgi:AcrR family transcriptional regulator
MTRSDAARSALLDAAERLFAENGISGVSDRRIAEEAGQKNHSAVAYHFGGRDGLLAELVGRHTWALEHERGRYFEESTSLLGDVRSLVLPTTDALAALQGPTWRARFLARAMYHQKVGELVREGPDRVPHARAISASILARLSHLSPVVATGRLSLMTQIIVTCCADVERDAERGQLPRWRGVGDFLVDSLTGMLQAPSSQTDPAFYTPTTGATA